MATGNIPVVSASKILADTHEHHYCRWNTGVSTGDVITAALFPDANFEISINDNLVARGARGSPCVDYEVPLTSDPSQVSTLTAQMCTPSALRRAPLCTVSSASSRSLPLSGW